MFPINVSIKPSQNETEQGWSKNATSLDFCTWNVLDPIDTDSTAYTAWDKLGSERDKQDHIFFGRDSDSHPQSAGH